MITLTRRLQNFYRYKLESILFLLYRREFGYLLGVITEKILKKNIYISYLRWRGHELRTTKQIANHKMTLDLTDLGLSRHLIIRHIHEPKATSAFLNTLQSIRDNSDSRNPTVIDVGANIGYFALLEAEVLGSHGNVYAFEPHPANRELLETNIKQNEYDNQVTIRAKAIGGSNGSAKLVHSDRSNWHRIKTDCVEDSIPTSHVELSTLDSVVEKEKIMVDSLIGIRMDVEGYESAIFSGMTKILNSNSPLVLYLEIHPSKLTDEESDFVFSRLKHNGFSVQFVGKDNQQLDINSIHEIEQVGGSHIRLVLSR